MTITTTSRDWQEVTLETLRDWPLPMPDEDGDKELRGRVLAVGGSREMPGGLLLAAEAALRSGAGKVALVTCASAALPLAMAVPESRVVALPETAAGGLDPAAVERVKPLAERADAILVGPGMQDEAAALALTQALVEACPKGKMVIDAAAMVALPRLSGRLRGDGNRILTPHAGEMAHLLDLDKDAVSEEAPVLARRCAERWQVILVLKGRVTWVAAPDGRLWRHDGGCIGLATSGSGDCLSGIIAALLARGAEPEQAATWAVVLHAQAGQRLSERLGPLGFLARELPGELPVLLRLLMPENLMHLGGN